MKSPLSIRPLVSITLLLTATLKILACGPYYPIIPTPEFFGLKKHEIKISEDDRQENLKLWQSLTSKKIPLSDIDEIVYMMSAEELENILWDSVYGENQFSNYLNNTGDVEVKEFLRLAKDMEQRWADEKSPWYYPRERGDHGGTGDYKDIVEYCKLYKGSRLRDRYSLQAVRALFASRKYAECIEYYDSAFAEFNDDNLMKRMAERYAAGCWSRLGYVAKADSMFAKAGDIMSISAPNRASYMAGLNPDAPQLMEYIRVHSSDTALMNDIAPIATDLLKSNKVKNRGDWEFMLAHYENEFRGDKKAASGHIRRALNEKFSDEELKDLARAYRMKLDAATGDRRSLLADLQWMEWNFAPVNNACREWKRRLGNIVYGYWVPRLWEDRDYSTAILLCAYADNIYMKGNTPGYFEYEDIHSYDFCPPSTSMSIDEYRKSEKFKNPLDYSSLSFQLMGSLKSAELSEVHKKMMTSTSPLYCFLRKKVRTDNDYYNELIGTIALREENYDRAVRFLSLVSTGYQRTMNIYKEKYLSRDPFKTYPGRWHSESWLYDNETVTWEWEWRASEYMDLDQTDAKLKFAQRMKQYKLAMSQAKTSDERGIARLMYAVGRKNSMEECWALTQYWRGSGLEMFYPAMDYWNDDFGEKHYAFLYDYGTSVGHKKTEEIFETEKTLALAMLKSDEAKAKAHYILGNLRTIVKHYPATRMAAVVRTSCDNWLSWI